MEETHFQALLQLQTVCIWEKHLKHLYVSYFIYMSACGHYAAAVGYDSPFLVDVGDVFCNDRFLSATSRKTTFKYNELSTCC